MFQVSQLTQFWSLCELHLRWAWSDFQFPAGCAILWSEFLFSLSPKCLETCLNFIYSGYVISSDLIPIVSLWTPSDFHGLVTHQIKLVWFETCLNFMYSGPTITILIDITPLWMCFRKSVWSSRHASTLSTAYTRSDFQIIRVLKIHAEDETSLSRSRQMLWKTDTLLQRISSSSDHSTTNDDII